MGWGGIDGVLGGFQGFFVPPALLAGRYPNATASQIKDALLKGADGSRNPVATARTNTGGAKLSQYGYLDVKKALDILEAVSPDLGPKPQPDRPNPVPPSSSQSRKSGGGCDAAGAGAWMLAVLALSALRRRA